MQEYSKNQRPDSGTNILPSQALGAKFQKAYADFSSATPIMQQYLTLKKQAVEQAEGALLFFRMGDFYELFFEDAEIAARVLEITLTARDKNRENPVPMAGVPWHSSQGYIQRLLKEGYKVAIAEQVEEGDKSPTQKIASREIVRFFSPAIRFDEQEGSHHAPAYLATLCDNALILLEPATGEVRYHVFGDIALASAQETASADSAPLFPKKESQDFVFDLENFLRSQNFSIAHFLLWFPQVNEKNAEFIRTGGRRQDSLSQNSWAIDELGPGYLAPSEAKEILKSHYLGEYSQYLPESSIQMGLAVLIKFLLKTQRESRLSHLKIPQPLLQADSLVLGPHAAQHLHLISVNNEPDLYNYLNKTVSAIGARTLKQWLYSPLRDAKQIQQRQSTISFLAQWEFTSLVRSALKGMYDVDRIAGRISTKLVSPSDLLALESSLTAIATVYGHLLSTGPEGHTMSDPYLCTLSEQLASNLPLIKDWALRLQKGLQNPAPATARDAEVFQRGFDAELDRLIDLSEKGQQTLVEMEGRERAATGIPSLKVRYNRVFGYYIEVTSAHLHLVPSHYQRKQTMVGAERFFTDELKVFEEEILTCGDKRRKLEWTLFQDLRDALIPSLSIFQSAHSILGQIDSLIALSEKVHLPGMVFPSITPVQDTPFIQIQKGRHPLLDESGFVPNDLHLGFSGALPSALVCPPAEKKESQESQESNDQSRSSNETAPSPHQVFDQISTTWLITGPNMGGKSTFMRQCAVLIVLGQMGCPIPAASASWSMVTEIFTRVGAHDALNKGQSTFMVEMNELAHILQSATLNSFIVLDEIGRGTSTFDGMSVAWAALEFLCEKIKARTVFATHYHELTALERQIPGLRNVHVTVERKTTDTSAGLRFLYEIQAGPASESFGIQVAEMAGLPSPVVHRAWQVLEVLEADQKKDVIIKKEQVPSATVAAMPVLFHSAVLDQLKNISVDQMTPLQALCFLSEIKKVAQEEVGFLLKKPTASRKMGKTAKKEKAESSQGLFVQLPLDPPAAHLNLENVEPLSLSVRANDGTLQP